MTSKQAWLLVQTKTHSGDYLYHQQFVPVANLCFGLVLLDNLELRLRGGKESVVE